MLGTQPTAFSMLNMHFITELHPQQFIFNYLHGFLDNLESLKKKLISEDAIQFHCNYYLQTNCYQQT